MMEPLHFEDPIALAEARRVRQKKRAVAKLVLAGFGLAVIALAAPRAAPAAASLVQSLGGKPAQIQPTLPWEQVAKGLAEGLKLDAEIACVGSATGDVAKLYTGVQDLEKKEYATGLTQIGEALEAMPTAFKQCNSTGQADVQKLHAAMEKLRAALEKMKHPSNITISGKAVETLLLDGINIYDDVKAAIADYKAAQWEQFGKDIGDALLKLVTPAGDLPKPEPLGGNKPWEQVLKGVLDGFGLSAEESCLSDAAGDVVALADAVEDIATEKEDKVKAGLRVLGGALEDLPATFAQCAAAVGDAEAKSKRLEEAIAEMKDPKAFAVHIGKDLLVNGVDIYHEVKDAVAAYKGKQWADFGEDIGKALSKLLIGVSAELVDAVFEKMHYRLVPAGGKLPVDACRNIPEGTYGDPEGNCEDHGYTVACTSCSQFASTYMVKKEGTCNQESTHCYFRAVGEQCVGTSVCPYKSILA